MAGRSKKVVRTGRAGVDADALLATYARWLKRQPLAPRSRDAYLAQVRAFVTWLASSEHGRDALSDPLARDRAVLDYKRHAKKVKRWAPASVNQALAGIDSFYRSLAAGRPAVKREHLAQVAPRSLEEADQRSFLRAVEASPSPRDRAMGTVFFYAGLRLSELAALDMADVEMSAGRGRVKVRSGKGDAYREVPLNSASRKALDDWLPARVAELTTSAEAGDDAGSGVDALWLSRSGKRMSSRAVDLVVRRLATAAHLELSADVLRHTFVTNLIRSGTDVVLVAEIAGHRRLDTTRRYSMPSQADKDAAVEAVLVEL